MGLITLILVLVCLQVFSVVLWGLLFRWIIKTQIKAQKKATHEYFRRLTEVLYQVFTK